MKKDFINENKVDVMEIKNYHSTVEAINKVIDNIESKTDGIRLKKATDSCAGVNYEHITDLQFRLESVLERLETLSNQLEL